VAFLSISIGTVNIPWRTVLSTLINGSDPLTKHSVIIWQLRIPRVILGIIVGASLGVSGAVLQGLLKNPLADPYVLGVSSGAAVGIALGILSGVTVLWSVPLFGFMGALLTLLLVYLIAVKNGKLPILSLVLAGIIVNAVFSSIIMLLLSFADQKMQGIMLWLMGNLSIVNVELLPFAGVLLCILSICALAFYRELNMLTAGEESAISFGVKTESVKKILFIIVSLLTAVAVSLSGMIGFIGLVVPHIVRFCVGSNYKWVLPGSMLAGSSILVLSDLIARSIIPSVEMPVGVVTALIGGPLFIVLLKRRTR